MTATRGGDGSRARDRNEAGRARQGRPRDALGRPLPYGARVSSRYRRAVAPDRDARSRAAVVRDGRPFTAHEVLEARWKAGPGEERDLRGPARSVSA